MDIYQLKEAINTKLPRGASLQLLAYWFMECKEAFFTVTPTKKVSFAKLEIQRIESLSPSLDYKIEDMHAAVKQLFYTPTPLELYPGYLQTFLSSKDAAALQDKWVNAEIISDWLWSARRELLVPLRDFLREIEYKQDTIYRLDQLIQSLKIVDEVQIPKIIRQLTDKINTQKVFKDISIRNAYKVLRVLELSHYEDFLKGAKELGCDYEFLLP